MKIIFGKDVKYLSPAHSSCFEQDEGYSSFHCDLTEKSVEKVSSHTVATRVLIGTKKREHITTILNHRS